MNKLLQIGIFSFSLLVSLVMGAALGLLHIPFRVEGSAVARFVNAVTPASSSWKAVHLLSTTCPCSRVVSAHLLRRGPFPGAAEYVVLAGNDAVLTQSLARAGFRVQSRNADAIASQFQVPGAPLFVLVSPAQKVVYAGGYSPRRDERSEYQDEQIWRNAASGFSYQTLPVYGCALGRQLQRKTDLFQLKYK